MSGPQGIQGIGLGLITAAVVFSAGGCGSRSSNVTQSSSNGPAAPVVAITPEVRRQLLDGAITVLRRLDDFDEQAAYAQVFDRLNQWSHAGIAEPPWRPEPLLATLPASLRQAVSESDLAVMTFDPRRDPQFLRDQRWLADVAATVRGDAIDDLEIAQRLFAWTVRCLALVPDPPMRPTASNPGSRWFPPGEILLSGRASAAQRSWIFLELLRHAGLKGMMLATVAAESTAEDPSSLVPWVPAVVSGGEAWLFDPTYGLPIPGPGGHGVATLRQARDDPSVLAFLDDDERRYPVHAEDIARLGILVAASPESLSRRMRMVEGHLVGASAMSLTVDVDEMVAEARSVLPESVSVDVALWSFPWEVRRASREASVSAAMARELAPMQVQLPTPARDGSGTRIFRPLFTARIREFRGELAGPVGAKSAYLAARPSDSSIRALVAAMPPQQADVIRRVVEEMKENATYLLGVATLGEGEFAAAIDFLVRMTLEANPDGPWADAARVNAASAYMAIGRLDEARALLEADESPQRFGSRLEARRLATMAEKVP